MTSLMLAGLGIAASAFAARFLMQSFKQLQQQASKLPKSPMFTAYYKGGFEPKITRREAGLILGISPSAPKDRIRDAHKRIMLLNHPDRGGSPYIAAKINEAKDYLNSNGKSERTNDSY